MRTPPGSPALPARIADHPDCIAAEQRWQDAQDAARTVRNALLHLDQAVSARYGEWQGVIRRLASQEAGTPS